MSLGKWLQIIFGTFSERSPSLCVLNLACRRLLERAFSQSSGARAVTTSKDYGSGKDIEAHRCSWRERWSDNRLSR